MLIELRIYYKNGTIAHNLIQCDDPTKWEGKNALTNVSKMITFETRAFEHNEDFKIIKIEKKGVLACKTKFKFTNREWCSGPGYSWQEEWWK